MPNLLFWVADKPEDEEPADEEPEQAPNAPRGRGPNVHVQSRYMSRSGDGKQTLKDYVFRAKL